MAAAHTAVLTYEGEDTLIRIPGHTALPEGELLVRQDTQGEELILSFSHAEKSAPTVAGFIAFRDSLPRDEHWNAFMKQRPHNVARTKPYPFSHEDD